MSSLFAFRRRRRGVHPDAAATIYPHQSSAPSSSVPHSSAHLATGTVERISKICSRIHAHSTVFVTLTTPRPPPVVGWKSGIRLCVRPLISSGTRCDFPSSIVHHFPAPDTRRDHPANHFASRRRESRSDLETREIQPR